MVKARKKESGFFDNMRRIRFQKQDELGEVYLKYLEPIYL